MPQEIPVHPAALLFPMMSERELSDLADDIAANGLMEPVVLYHGQILDGRNRLAACELGGIEPRFVEVDGELPSAALYVLSKNLHRRHLTSSQRAAIAADMVPLLAGEAKKRQLCGKKIDLPANLQEGGGKGEAAEIAADAVGVHSRSVYKAQAIKRESPEKFEEVKAGKTSVDKAYAEIPHRPNGKKEREPWNGHKGKRAPTQKERMISGLSHITGLCRGLIKEVDIPLALSICTDEDKQMLLDRARESAKNLRTFISEVERTTTNA